jgi:hypothetical protein
MRLRYLSTLAALVCVAALGGCDSPSAPSDAGGSIELRFSGSPSGSLTLSGPRFTSPTDGPYVHAVAETENIVSITAFRRVRSGMTDLLVLTVPRAAGTYPLSCGEEGCLAMRGSIGSYRLTSGGPIEFTAKVGTITVTQVDAGHLRGSFSVTAEPSSGPDAGPTRKIEGTFDAEL